ncbi:MAG TPA: exodeoxyribonuclease VII large subunit [Steroidobacteraceae bacterium]|nr:exodeoxyribonuclease VII large subunit [Steroidobacteraceae bacterium]
MSVKTERDIYTVSRLNNSARVLLETGLPALWVEGEISNFACPASGHWYFTLKDRDAQIRCAMFRTRNSQVGFRPRDGQQMLIRGRVSLYEPRGDYQLLAEAMEDAGEGALRREFEKLKARLAGEGLFDSVLKRPLPAMPRRIAVITSPTGAAIRDVLHILARRFPPAEILVFATPVQGAAATQTIVAAIDRAATRGDCDVMIVTRGGGSIEDLWCFNDERVARAIRRSAIPVITGIGHEIDFTIADFAADVRAPTPSGAAELVVPDRSTLLAAVRNFATRMQGATQRQLQRALERHEQLLARLRRAHPGSRLQQQTQRLDELDLRLRRAWDSRLLRISQRLLLTQRALDAISPLATLQRGFAIVSLPDGQVLQDGSQVQPGDVIEARLARGSVLATVTASRGPDRGP